MNRSATRAFPLLVLLLLLLGVGCNRVAVARHPGPNVLLVTLDTLRADHVGAYGADFASTPTLDRLAAEGARVETVVAPTPLTLPSHASILTGRTPPHHGVRHNGVHRLADDVPTLATRLSSAGYATGAVVAAAVLAGRHGLARGFDHYDDHAFSQSASSTGFAERTATEVTDASLAWLEDAPRPFFLWAHYYDPHGAYRPPEPWATRFADRPYDGEIAYTDAELGRLIGWLRDRGELDQTLVVVTADHGESLGEHGEHTHAYTVYDAALRVPLILRGPGVAAGTVVAGIASNLDVAPTVLARIDAPASLGLGDVDGRDLSPRLAATAIRADGAPSESAEPPPPVYAESLATELDHGWAPLHAARSDGHLYIRAPRAELYDVVRDPGQLHNLLPSDDGATLDVAAELEGVVDTALSRARAAAGVELDARQREQLRSLGYVAGEAAAMPTGLDPKDGLPLLNRFIAIEALYQHDQLDEALARALALLEEMSESPRLLDLLARIHLSRGAAAEGLHYAERAAARVPESARHREMLGTLRLEARDPAGAVADFEAALARDPGHAEARAGLMWRLALGGTVEAAEADAQAAIALRPGDTALLALVARHWDRLGHYDRALAQWDAVLEIDPSHTAAKLGRALQLVRIGDLDEARRLLAGTGNASHGPRYQLTLAVAYAARGERSTAAGLLEELVQRHPDWPPPQRVLAKVTAEIAAEGARPR